MNEYISKQSVLDYLNGYLHSIGKYNLLLDIGQRRALTNAIQDIGAMKSADVQPVEHGRWLGDEVIQCSNCNFTLNGASFGRIVHKYFDYCPNCGARMDLKDGEQNES